MWTPEQRFCILDYETRCEVDLRKLGSYEYGKHPSSRLLCAAWRFGTRAELAHQIKSKVPAKVWSPGCPGRDDDPNELVDHLLDEEVISVAHNAFFEQCVTAFILPKHVKKAHPLKEYFNPEKWICTASMARAVALPGRLELVGEALSLPIQKDKEGHRLMLKYCKPRKPTKTNKNLFHNILRELRRIMLYCQIDIDAETLIFLLLPDLIERERVIWLLDQKINLRGFKADRELVERILGMIEIETEHLNDETSNLTLGEVISALQRDGILEWLESEGVFLPNLQAKTVSDAIKTGLVEGDSKRILEIRQAVSKTSTKKYKAFEMRSRTDSRVRDNLVYSAASTGRWGGAGVQPQNFPRGGGYDTKVATDVIRSSDLQTVDLIYGDPMNVFSSCLRSMIVASDEKEFFCGDWAAIEARVLFWIAKYEAGIKAFAENRPMYEEMATKIYGISLEELLKRLKEKDEIAKTMRQIGKQAVLGCGYGMGHKKFKLTCFNYGVKISEDLAKTAVNAYRETHWQIPTLWGKIERAAIFAVQEPGKRVSINHTKWWVKDKFLWCELPSTRRLAYYGPEVKWEPTPWGEKRPKLYHWGVNSKTKKWTFESTYGGKLVENVVQAVSRDIMAEAMLRAEKEGYEIVLSVHDEILAERKVGEREVKNYEEILAQVPTWAPDCPIKVEAWKGPRYKK